MTPDDEAVEVNLDSFGVARVFGLQGDAPTGSGLMMEMPAVRTRSGHQLKLVFANPEMSMNALAKREGWCRTKLARLVGFSCVAPELIQLAVGGQQPVRLTAELLQSAPLRMAWVDQMRTFEGVRNRAD